LEILNLGKNLRRILKQRKLVVREFSELSGVSTQTIDNILNYRRNDYRLSTVISISNALGVDIDDLLERKKEFIRKKSN